MRADASPAVRASAGVSAAPLIRVQNLRIAFGQGRDLREVVSGVSFAVEPGQCLALVGESGSGKSVTARSLIGLNGAAAHVTADVLALRGQDLLSLRERQWRGIRGRSIGYILQDALVSLDPLRTIGQELREAIRATKAVPREEEHAYALQLLQRAQMPDAQARHGDYPAQLSGGLRQRALIATAIAGDPQVLIADEPTTALDVSVQQQILALFADLKRSGIALILISHDLAVVSKLADHVVILKQGRVVESGTAAQVLGSPVHVYTRELIDAIPRFDRSGRRGAASAIDAGESVPPPRVDEAPILRAISISKRFAATAKGQPGREALREVSIALRRGRTLGLVGESGSGKTTFGRIIAGLETASSGDIVTTEALSKPSGQAHPVQFVYQDPLSAFDPRYTVGKTLEEALRMRFGRESRARRLQRVAHWLQRVGLDPALQSRRPLTLSGGQRQRVAIARALAVEPQLVVLDEPVSALDVAVQKQILELINLLQRETQVAFLFISHDLGVIQQVSHEVAVLRDGVLREYGNAQSVLGDPADAYTRELLAAIPQLAAVADPVAF